MHAVYVLLIVGALAGGFTVGLTGFGTALTALGIWLYVLPPSIAVQLVLISSVVAQSSSLPAMWRTFNFKLIWPFIIGGLVGVPLGTMLVTQVDPQIFKLTIGLFLLVFPIALYFSAPMAFTFGGRFADGLVGFAGGILGGFAGLSGPLPILWATIRDWSKDERRGVFQMYNWTMLFTAVGLQAASGRIGWQVLWYAALAFPATVVGSLLGARLYHVMSDRNFRDVVLGMLVLSGLGLLWASISMR